MKSRTVLVFVTGIVIGVAATSICGGRQPISVAAQPNPPQAVGIENDAASAPARQPDAALPESQADRLKQFESVMDRYFRGAELEKATSALKESVDQYNKWAETTQKQHEAARAEFAQQVASFQATAKQIEDMDKRLANKPRRGDAAAVAAYNALATRRNKMVEDYNRRAPSLESRQKDLNAAVVRWEQEAKSRREQLSARQAALQEKIDARNRWIESDAGISFFRDLNRFYAQLHAESPTGEPSKPNAMIDRLRAMRRELAQEAIQGQERVADGLMIVEATLCGREKCSLIVDTGARFVTISPALVDTLGLRDRLGEKAQLTLAGGMRATGRQLTIPQLSVLGREMKDVKAVMLDEPGIGVDGLLGMSFLHRFKIRIDPGQPEKLVLEPRSGQ